MRRIAVFHAFPVGCVPQDLTTTLLAFDGRSGRTQSSLFVSGRGTARTSDGGRKAGFRAQSRDPRAIPQGNVIPRQRKPIAASRVLARLAAGDDVSDA